MATNDPHAQHRHGHGQHGHHAIHGGGTIAAAGSTDAAHAGHGGHDHAAMVADFRRRFWITLLLTPAILLLSPMIQHLPGARPTRRRVGWESCHPPSLPCRTGASS
jgi:Cu2+-exporting ATPase